MRHELRLVLEELLAEAKGGPIDIDRFALTIGPLAPTPDEIDAVMAAIERAGGEVSAPAGGDGEANLKRALASARELRAELGRTPSPAEIAARAGLSEPEVRRALALGRVIGQ